MGLENQHINSGAPLFVPTHARDGEEVLGTLTASYGTGGADLDTKPLVHNVAYNITFCDANGTRKDRPNGGLYVNETDTSNTLTRAGVGTFACDTYNGTIQGDVAATMTSSMAGSSSTGLKVMVTHGISNNPSIGHCLRSGASKADKPDSTTYVTDMRVRRLTPIECERLQGFPDDYTNIKEKTPDGSRYKALGNSMAVPVMKWIGERINAHEATTLSRHGG